MKEQLTETEINKIQKMCFLNPEKGCAIAQIIINTCQVVSCSTFANLNDKSKRTVQYQSGNLTGLDIENRRFISFNQ